METEKEEPQQPRLGAELQEEVGHQEEVEQESLWGDYKC